MLFRSPDVVRGGPLIIVASAPATETLNKLTKVALDRVLEFVTGELPACSSAFTILPDLEATVTELETATFDEPRLRDALHSMATAVIETLNALPSDEED